MPGIFDPLIPQSWIDPLQQRLDQRRLDQSPEEARLRGFGAGALEGLRGLSSPASLAGLLPGGAAAKLLQFAPKAARAVGPTLDVIEQTPIRQITPSMDDVSALIGTMKRNLAKVPAKGSRPIAPNIPEFAPVTAPVISPVVRGLKSASPNRAAEELAEEAFRKYVRR